MPTPTQMNPSNWNAQPTRLATQSRLGPIVLPVSFDFTANDSYKIDLTLPIQRKVIDMVQYIYIDNKDGAAPVDVTWNNTQQRVSMPPYEQGYLPVLAPPEPNGVIVSSPGNGAQITIHFLNFIPPGVQWAARQGIPSSWPAGAFPVSDLILEAGVVGGYFQAQQFALTNLDAKIPLYTDPTTYTAALTAAATANIVTPGANQYFVVQEYSIEVTGDATLAVAGRINLSIMEGATARITHSLYLPAAAPVTNGVLFHIHRENLGFISKVAAASLGFNLDVALTAGIVRASVGYSLTGYAG